MSAKPDMNIRDLAKLANIADLIGYTDFDGTHFTADGYEPVAMTAYTATMKRLKRADKDTRKRIASVLESLGYDRVNTRGGKGEDAYSIARFTKGTTTWEADWSTTGADTVWSIHSPTVGHMRNVTNGRALSYVLRDGA